MGVGGRGGELGNGLLVATACEFPPASDKALTLWGHVPLAVQQYRLAFTCTSLSLKLPLNACPLIYFRGTGTCTSPTPGMTY